MKLPLVLFTLLAATPGHTPTPSVTPKEWVVTLHDDVDPSALDLACSRVGPKELQCVDLRWLLETRDRLREHAQAVEERKEQQRRAWGCGEDSPSTECKPGPNAEIKL